MPQAVLNLTQADVKVINDLAGLMSFIPTQQSRWLMNSRAKVKFLCSGNRAGKTAGVVVDEIIAPILGMHPTRNMTPDQEIRTMRLAAEVLPGGGKENDVASSVYPLVRRFLPPSLIKSDVTARDKTIVVRSPLGGRDVVIEFVSYNQAEQRQAGVDRWLVWCDEAPNQTFWQESLMRLAVSEGPLILTYTPVPGAGGWVFEDVYETADRIYRTKRVRDRIELRTGVIVPEIEVKGTDNGIDVIICSTYDNPILSHESIEQTLSAFEDESDIDARCYGLFRELGGSVYKKFQPGVHVINWAATVPGGAPPPHWRHFRAADWHTREPIAVVWASLSPEDELFIWQEANPSPVNMVTPQIADMIASKSGELKYVASLIDPLANTTQTNSGMTTVEDLNGLFRQFKRDGLCAGGYWEPWDTKGEVGREKLRERLHNSITCGRPFNNKSVRDGRTVNLPTVWIASECRNIIDSLKKWRYEEWKNRESEAEKGEKPKPIGRWSHFCTAIEALLKDNRVSRAHFGAFNFKPSGKMYYGGGR